MTIMMKVSCKVQHDSNSWNGTPRSDLAGRTARMSAKGYQQESEDEQQEAIMRGARMSASWHPRCRSVRSIKETEDDRHGEGGHQGATRQRKLEWNTKERPTARKNASGHQQETEDEQQAAAIRRVQG